MIPQDETDASIRERDASARISVATGPDGRLGERKPRAAPLAFASLRLAHWLTLTLDTLTCTILANGGLPACADTPNADDPRSGGLPATISQAAGFLARATSAGFELRHSPSILVLSRGGQSRVHSHDEMFQRQAGHLGRRMGAFQCQVGFEQPPI